MNADVTIMACANPNRLINEGDVGFFTISLRGVFSSDLRHDCVVLFLCVLSFVIISHEHLGLRQCLLKYPPAKPCFSMISVAPTPSIILLGALLSLGALSVSLAATLIIECSSSATHFALDTEIHFFLAGESDHLALLWPQPIGTRARQST